MCSALTAIRCCRLMQLARLVVSILAPVLAIILVNEDCLGGWKLLWYRCTDPLNYFHVLIDGGSGDVPEPFYLPPIQFDALVASDVCGLHTDAAGARVRSSRISGGSCSPSSRTRLSSCLPRR